MPDPIDDTKQGQQGQEGATGGAPPTPPPSTPATTPTSPTDPSAGGASGGTAPTEDELRFSREQFNSRIAQAKTSAQKAAEDQKRQWLKEKFGTDSDAEIEAKLKAWSELEKEKEEAKRAAMSEAERLKADLAKEQKLRQTAEQRAKELESTYLYEKQDNVISRLAQPHINEKYLSFAKRKFAEHLKEQGPEVAAKMTEKDIVKWFKVEFVKEYPELARPSGEPPKTPPKKEPLGNGPGPNAPKPPPNKTPTNKTAKPGQPNSMSKSELRNHLKTKGLSGW